MGGHDKWCIDCDLIKDTGNTVKPRGYLSAIRYDMACSLEHTFVKGKDTKELVKLLVQYIHDTYPAVKELSFNDCSTRTCDDNVDVNLAVMTYLYSEQTWYEKTFGAYILPEYETEWANIKTRYNHAKHDIGWDDMKEIIKNDERTTKMSDGDMEELYKKSESWKEFFEGIYRTIHIDKFCIFVSTWLNRFIVQYFNTLCGVKFAIPIKDQGIQYTESEYKRGGKRHSRKATRKHAKDYH